LIHNTTYDLSAEERASVIAADAAGHEAARLGTPGIVSAETAIVARLIEAARGRGVCHIFAQILELYHNSSSAAQMTSITQAMSCLGVDGKAQGTF
jgi:hypothetical protein